MGKMIDPNIMAITQSIVQYYRLSQLKIVTKSILASLYSYFHFINWTTFISEDFGLNEPPSTENHQLFTS